MTNRPEGMGISLSYHPQHCATKHGLRSVEYEMWSQKKNKRFLELIKKGVIHALRNAPNDIHRLPHSKCWFFSGIFYKKLYNHYVLYGYSPQKKTVAGS